MKLGAKRLYSVLGTIGIAILTTGMVLAITLHYALGMSLLTVGGIILIVAIIKAVRL